MLKKGFYNCSFYYSNFKSIKSNVYLVGEFPSSFWKIPVKMKFDPFFHSFKCNIFIKEGFQFKFIENGNYVTSFDYKITYDKFGFQNNIFVLNHKSLHQISQKASRNSRWHCQSSPLNNSDSNTCSKDHKLNSKNLQLLDSLNSTNIEKFERYPILEEILRKKSERSDSKEIIHHTDMNELTEEDKLNKDNLDKKKINHDDQGKTIGDEDSNTTELDENLNNQIQIHGLTFWNEKDLKKIDKILESIPNQNVIKDVENSEEKKNSKLSHRNLVLKSAYYCIPKSRDCCEDANFILENAIGVSDGVGGWANYGFSAELFSQYLMKNCEDLISRKESSHCFSRKRTDTVDSFFSENENNWKPNFSRPLLQTDMNIFSWAPEKVLQEAFENVTVPGSATALLCILCNNQLRCCSIGDSKLLVVKMEGSKAVKLFATKGQQHDFNTTFQLANIPNPKSFNFLMNSKSPNQIEALVEKFRNAKFCCDNPEDGESYQIIVNKNDLLILGTDGLFDNLFEHEILEIVENHLSNKKVISKDDINSLAYSLARRAQEKSNDYLCESPFKENYIKELKEKWNGGKVDDITVIVSLVE